MAKTKKKISAIDVLYRVLMAGMAACVLIAAFFSKFYYILVDSSALQILSRLSGKTEDSGATLLNRSLYETFNMFSGSTGETGGTSGIWDKVWAAFADVHGAIICTVVFFVMALLIALVLFFFSCFSGKKLVPICLSAGGIVSLIAMRIAFNTAAAPVLAGEISLASLLGSSSSVFSSIVGSLAEVSVARLDTAWFVMLFLFIGMLVWAGAYMLIEAGDKKKRN